jgi:hypothetical protein
LEIFFLGNGISERDLFGDPVQSREKGRGRPAHQWTLENSNRVLLMFAAGATPKQAATAIGVSVPTLRQHYFFEVAQREAAALRMEATQLARLNGQAEKGNVAAEKELAKRLDKIRVARISDQVAGRQGKTDRPAKVGKKEAAKAGAAAIKGKYAPPAAPQLLN